MHHTTGNSIKRALIFLFQSPVVDLLHVITLSHSLNFEKQHNIDLHTMKKIAWSQPVVPLPLRKSPVVAVVVHLFVELLVNISHHAVTYRLTPLTAVQPAETTPWLSTKFALAPKTNAHFSETSSRRIRLLVHRGVLNVSNICEGIGYNSNALDCCEAASKGSAPIHLHVIVCSRWSYGLGNRMRNITETFQASLQSLWNATKFYKWHFTTSMAPLRCTALCSFKSTLGCFYSIFLRRKISPFRVEMVISIWELRKLANIFVIAWIQKHPVKQYRMEEWFS